MIRLFNTVSRIGLSAAANAALATVAGAVALGGIALTALYLIEAVDETPALVRLLCLAGIERADCPRHTEEMARLQAERDALQARIRAAEDDLRGLRAVDDVDTVTFFQEHEAPDSPLTVHVGTVYDHLIGNLAPVHHYCYIALSSGPAGETRNLHIHDSSGPVGISPDAMRAAGVTQATLAYARSVCRPFLIGEG